MFASVADKVWDYFVDSSVDFLKQKDCDFPMEIGTVFFFLTLSRTESSSLSDWS